jgi:hypothetical protein
MVEIGLKAGNFDWQEFENCVKRIEFGLEKLNENRYVLEFVKL